MSDRRWEITLLYHGKEYLVGLIPTTHIPRSKLILLMRSIFAKYTLTADEIVRAHLKRGTKRHSDLIVVSEEFNEPNIIRIVDGSNWVTAIVRRPGDPVQDDLPPPPRTAIVPD